MTGEDDGRSPWTIPAAAAVPAAAAFPAAAAVVQSVRTAKPTLTWTPPTAPPSPTPPPPRLPASAPTPVIDPNDPPATRWRQFLDHLQPSPRNVLAQNAVFAGIDESGRVTLNVRTSVIRGLVKSTFDPLDPSPWFPTFRNVDVRIDTGGVTGNERRTAAEDALVARATAAAEASPLLKRVLDTFGGTLERIETIATVAPETALPPLEDEEG